MKKIDSKKNKHKLFDLKGFQVKKQLKKIVGFSILGGIFGFLLYFTLARLLNPEDYGIFYTFIVFTFFFMIGQESIKIFSAKYSTKYFCDKNFKLLNKFYNENIKRIFFYSIPLFMLFIAFYPIVGKLILNTDIILYSIFGLAIFFVFLYPLCLGILQGINKFKESSLMYTLYSIIFYVLSVLSILFGFGLKGILFSIVISNAIISFLSMFIVRKSLNSLIKEDNNSKGKKSILDDKEILNNGMKKFFIAILTIFGLLMFFSMVDVILARYFFNANDSALYSGLSTISKILFFAAFSTSKGLFLKIIESNHIDDKKLKKETNKMLTFGILGNITLGVLFFIAAYFFPELIINIVLGTKYLAVTSLLKYVVISMSLLGMSTFIIFYNLAIDWNKKFTAKIVGTFLFLEIVLVFIFHKDLMQFILMNIISNLFLFFSVLSTIKTDD